MRLCDLRHYHSPAFNASIKLSLVNSTLDKTVNSVQNDLIVSRFVLFKHEDVNYQ